MYVHIPRFCYAVAVKFLVETSTGEQTRVLAADKNEALAQVPGAVRAYKLVELGTAEGVSNREFDRKLRDQKKAREEEAAGELRYMNEFERRLVDQRYL